MRYFQAALARYHKPFSNHKFLSCSNNKERVPVIVSKKLGHCDHKQGSAYACDEFTPTVDWDFNPVKSN